MGRMKIKARNIAIGILGGIALNYAAYFAVERAMDYRYNSYTKAARELKLEQFAEKPSGGFFEQAKFLYRVSQIERSFNRNLDSFKKFAETNQKTLVDIADKAYETGGWIETDGSKFYFVRRNRWQDDAKKYLSEMSNGNFTHSDDLLALIGSYTPAFAKDEKELQSLLGMIDFGRTYRRDPDYAEKRMSGTGYTKEILKESYQEILSIFKGIITDLDNLSAERFDKQFLDNSRIFAGFHNHPRNKGPPSIEDLANSILFTPSIVIRLDGNMLIVHAINKGTSTEIYSVPVRSY